MYKVTFTSKTSHLSTLMGIFPDETTANDFVDKMIIPAGFSVCVKPWRQFVHVLYSIDNKAVTDPGHPVIHIFNSIDSCWNYFRENADLNALISRYGTMTIVKDRFYRGDDLLANDVFWNVSTKVIS